MKTAIEGDEAMALTADLIISWNPYPALPPERVRNVCAPLGETFTALNLLRHDALPAEDRLWVVLREEVMDDRTLRLFACRCARRALDRERAAGREPNARSWAAVVERFERGDAAVGELVTAWDTANSASTDAWVAGWKAAEAVGAYVIAYANAADAAEREAQVNDLIELLSGM